jgi:hypothetical protein
MKGIGAMKSLIRNSIFVVAVAFARPAVAQAGMPGLDLTDAARLRIETISFFLLVFLVSSWLIQVIWNKLRGDFSFLPRLSLGKAVGLVTLWGLLFVLVLTMISGARELMTPGAWDKVGLTYRLKQEPARDAVSAAPLSATRQEKLSRLSIALWSYASTHHGRFPANANEIPKNLWEVPDSSTMHYVYIPGQSIGKEGTPLVYEPEIFGPERLLLVTNGDIRRVEPRDQSPGRVASKQ